MRKQDQFFLNTTSTKVLKSSARNSRASVWWAGRPMHRLSACLSAIFYRLNDTLDINFYFATCRHLIRLSISVCGWHFDRYFYDWHFLNLVSIISSVCSVKDPISYLPPLVLACLSPADRYTDFWLSITSLFHVI